MGAETTIEWTASRAPDGTVLPGATFNVVWGCQRVSPGCVNCYAETWAKRHGHDVWGPATNTPRRVLSDDYWKQPIAWAKQALKLGVRRKVFCSSMADVFEDHPTVATQRERLWPLIEATTEALDWLLLTKRPENVLDAVPDRWRTVGRWPRAVWVGASAESQEWYDRRLPHLNAIPAPITFWSMEPLIGPIVMSARDRVAWIITGGESGPNARPCQPSWVRSLRDQCEAAGVAYFHKQWGEYIPYGQQMADGTDALDYAARLEAHTGKGPERAYFGDGAGDGWAYRVGKKAAGRLLDGRTWDQMPD